MKFESSGILIGMRPFGERDAIAHIFTQDHGVMTGMLRGATVARKNKSLVGQIGAMSWNARLDSQLGVFHWESDKNLTANLMLYPKLLGIVNSIFSLIHAMLPERERYDILYTRTQDMLRIMANNSHFFGTDTTDELTMLYLSWEIELLRELGYALNLTCCSNCKCTNDLNYISPRTGRAVCDNCATPYKDRLYNMPLTLNVTQNFLESVCSAQGTTLPLARKLIMI